MKSPCYDCKDRNGPCHDTCEPYKAWAARLKEIRDAERKDKKDWFLNTYQKGARK